MEAATPCAPVSARSTRTGGQIAGGADAGWLAGARKRWDEPMAGWSARGPGRGHVRRVAPGARARTRTLHQELAKGLVFRAPHCSLTAPRFSPRLWRPPAHPHTSARACAHRSPQGRVHHRIKLIELNEHRGRPFCWTVLHCQVQVPTQLGVFSSPQGLAATLSAEPGISPQTAGWSASHLNCRTRRGEREKNGAPVPLRLRFDGGTRRADRGRGGGWVGQCAGCAARAAAPDARLSRGAPYARACSRPSGLGRPCRGVHVQGKA